MHIQLRKIEKKLVGMTNWNHFLYSSLKTSIGYDNGEVFFDSWTDAVCTLCNRLPLKEKYSQESERVNTLESRRERVRKNCENFAHRILLLREMAQRKNIAK